MGYINNITKYPKVLLRQIYFLFFFLILIIPGGAIAESTEEFKPDIELVRKLAVTSYSEAIKELDKLPPDNTIKYCLIMADIHNTQFNNTKTAMQYCDHALEISEKHNLRKCQIYLTKAFINDNMTNIIETINNLEKAVDCFKKDNDVNSLKLCLSSLGSLLYRYGQFQKSLNSYKQALKICEDTNDIITKNATLFDIGEVYYRLGNITAAKKFAEQAKEMFEKSGNTKGIADCLKLLGNTCLDSEHEKKKQYYLDACKLYEQTNDQHGLANCYFNLGLMNKNRKNYTDAVHYFNKALLAYTNAGSVEGVGITHMELGRNYYFMKEYNKAELSLSQAEQFLNRQTQYRLAQTKDYQGDLFAVKGKLQEALKCYNISAELYKITGLERDVIIEERKIKDLNAKIKSNKQ